MKRLKSNLATLVIILLCGCAVLAPRTAALKSVHQTYRDDFAHWMVPSPADKPAPLSFSNQPPFSATLQAIRNFRARYGEDSAEAAHLTVLEGMVYLQSGRVGMAKLIAAEVAKAGQHLQSATGKNVRDALFAENFADLLTGWEEINDESDNDDATFTEWQKLRDAANAIEQRLQQKIQDKKLADADADQGGIYLATTAGIFYVWAYAYEKIENPQSAAVDKQTWFTNAREIIGSFLSSTEKEAAADPSLNQAATGRLRYLLWYGWLGTSLNN